ncbi:helix-turn-helix transcriptional regulator [bacterium]|nr:helix-turn-helix transcriptional regulator [bacterium]
MNNENKLGKRIKLLRKSMGLTQEQLAEKIDIDYKYLSKIENGLHCPSYKTLLKISTILDTSLGELNDVFATIDENKSPEFLKALKILESAADSDEEAYYLDVLELAQKGLKLRKK